MTTGDPTVNLEARIRQTFPLPEPLSGRFRPYSPPILIRYSRQRMRTSSLASEFPAMHSITLYIRIVHFRQSVTGCIKHLVGRCFSTSALRPAGRKGTTIDRHFSG
jgi:hypothetical protein